jgi:hypothetical protein
MVAKNYPSTAVLRIISTEGWPMAMKTNFEGYLFDVYGEK